MSPEAQAILRLTDVIDDLIAEVDRHIYPDDFSGISHLSSAIRDIQETLTGGDLR